MDRSRYKSIGNKRATVEDIQHDQNQARLEYLESGGEDHWHGFTSTKFTHQSAATPPTCKESCGSCEEQFVPRQYRMRSEEAVVEYHSDAEATSEIKGLMEGTEKNLKHVREMIDEYGNTILKRWHKQSKAKQTETIRKVMPHMFPYKHTDADIQYRLAGSAAALVAGATLPQIDSRIKYEDANLIPWLNIETLTEDYTRLLALLHYRSHIAMVDWFIFDRLQLQTSFSAGIFSTAYNPHCVKVSGHDFGALVQWKKGSSHGNRMIGYPCARQIFKAQYKISSFLKGMVDKIMATNIDDAIKGSENWTSLQEASFQDPKILVGPSAYRIKPFSPPTGFDIDAFKTIIETRYRQAEDELVQLQTEPALLRDLLQREKNGTRLASISPDNKHRALHKAPHNIYARFTIWNIIQWMFQEFESCYKTAIPILREGGPLSDKEQIALDILQGSLDRHMGVMLHMISESSSKLVAQVATDTRPARELYRDDKLLWALNELMKVQGGSEIGVSISSLIATIDERVSEESNRVDQSLYDQLADISAIDEAIRLIDHYRHRAGPLINRQAMLSTYEGQLVTAFFGKVPNIYSKHSGAPQSLDRAINDFMAFPRPKPDRPAIADLSLNLELHKALARIWDEFDTLTDDYLTKCSLSSQAITLLLAKSRPSFRQPEQATVIERDQDAIKLALEEKETEDRERQSKKDPVAEAKEFIPIIEDAEERFKTLSIAGKPKHKTRPPGAMDRHEKHDAIQKCVSNTEQHESSPVRIAVKTPSMDIFASMFSRAEPQQTRARWEDLVRAMADAGFSATHGGGSAVTFDDKQGQKGAITVHRPHPDSVLELIKLRAIGRRLTKWLAGVRRLS